MRPKKNWCLTLEIPWLYRADKQETERFGGKSTFVTM